MKEASVGFLNGAILGILIAIVAWLWKGNPEVHRIRKNEIIGHHANDSSLDAVDCKHFANCGLSPSQPLAPKTLANDDG